ncbi:hypothetical protein [Xylanimonas protaetiae]|nr:hypothetical protein [Xylanimonas protaetiae]
MTDVAYVLLTVVLFAAIAVVARRSGDRAVVPATTHVPPAADGSDS